MKTVDVTDKMSTRKMAPKVLFIVPSPKRKRFTDTEGHQ